ncbi:DUF6779 domain-containing protein [Gordonia iterans]|uniref:DUF6779 domain-containing protein n=1 Tax=Gordonia iterans TaxID=1004901 RepID=UPI0026D66FFB|nr:DUF6779 domain-containing protein [Gordonia iterans]
MTSTNRTSSATRRTPRRSASKAAAASADPGVVSPSNGSSSSGASGGSGQVAQWLLGLFIVLAVIASLLMVFGGDISLTGSLAVISALWAAVIGAVLVTKYRRQADVAELRSRDQRDVYELQLEREIAARRQYESEVEIAIRHEVAEENNEEFEALKAQVLALRANLEELLGNPLPEVPLALRPERRRELGSGLAGVGYAATADDRVAADLDFESTAPATEAGRHAPEPAGATGELPVEQPGDVEMTEIIPVVTDEEPTESGGPEYHETEYYEVDAQVRPATDEPEPAHYTASEYEYTSSEYTATEYYSPAEPYSPAEHVEANHDPAPHHYGQSHQYGEPQQQGYEPTAYDAASYQPPVPGAPQVPQVPEVPPMPQRGRRASSHDDGAHTDGLSVNELLSRLRENGGRQNPGGRRRRD